MIVKSESWADIPLLHIYNMETQLHSPIIIFLHGFESAKEHNLHYAYQLVQKGCRVLLPDAHLHGERDQNLDQVELSLRFWETILTSIDEVGRLKEQLELRDYLTDQKIGIAGTSMGGITALGCLTVYSWLDAAAIMMGTPAFVELAKAQISGYEKKGFKLPITAEERANMYNTLARFDATNHMGDVANRPLFFWHGEKDPVVPFESTANFVEALKKQYGGEKLILMQDKSAGHAVSRKGMLTSMKWLAEHLA